jgi:hypothetical protein
VELSDEPPRHHRGTKRKIVLIAFIVANRFRLYTLEPSWREVS